MNRYAVGLMLAMLTVPQVALGQQSPEERIQAAMRRAQAAGVPTSLLQSRIAEGRAKGVPADRIAAAVEIRATSLLRAREAMRGARGLSQADLSAGADAVEAGIEEGALQQVIAAARAEDRPVAIAVLTYLHREQRLPVDQALARVNAALKKGPEALRQLPAQAAAAAGRRGPPEGVGRPAGAGRPGRGGGPPEGLPAPGKEPGSGKPDGVGKPDGAGPPDGAGRPDGGGPPSNPGGGRGRP